MVDLSATSTSGDRGAARSTGEIERPSRWRLRGATAALTRAGTNWRRGVGAVCGHTCPHAIGHWDSPWVVRPAPRYYDQGRSTRATAVLRSVPFVSLTGGRTRADAH